MSLEEKKAEAMILQWIDRIKGLSYKVTTLANDALISTVNGDLEEAFTKMGDLEVEILRETTERANFLGKMDDGVKKALGIG